MFLFFVPDLLQNVKKNLTTKVSWHIFASNFKHCVTWVFLPNHYIYMVNIIHAKKQDMSNSTFPSCWDKYGNIFRHA